jgi:hypothetical protein
LLRANVMRSRSFTFAALLLSAIVAPSCATEPTNLLSSSPIVDQSDARDDDDGDDDIGDPPGPSPDSDETASPVPAEPLADPSSMIDPDGVELKAKRNPNGSAWRLGAKDPNTDPEVVLRFAASVTKEADYWKATAESNLSFRINVNVKASQGDQESDHATLAKNGYMVSKSDLRNLEMTGYFRVHDVNDQSEGISIKVRGGQHTGSNDPRAACIGLVTEYTDGSTSLWEKELFHPTTPKAKVTKLETHPPLEDKWVGLKAVVWNIDGDTKSVSEMWIDTDPFDAAGKPKNGWKKVYTVTDDGSFGGRAVTWGGKYATWRIDAAKTIDFKLLSVHEIIK